MKETSVEITVDADQLQSLHQCLNEFMNGLSEEQQEAMALILARASAATSASSAADIDEHLLSVHGKPGLPTLAMVAKALDGEKRWLRDGPDEANNAWSYTIWTYNHDRP